MKDNYELKNPRGNPYAERMKNGYTIIIERGPDSDEQKEAQDIKLNVRLSSTSLTPSANTEGLL